MDSTLAPWQREFMLGVARRGLEPGAAGTATTLPGIALQESGAVADDGSWTLIPPSSGRVAHSTIYDPVRDRMIVFGGTDGSVRNNTLAMSLAAIPAWSELATGGDPPSERVLQTAIYDPVRDRMVVFGGQDSEGLCNDVWTLSLGGNPLWTKLVPAGNPPSARFMHSAIYDPVRDRMVVFGGLDPGPRNDLWALSFAGIATWSEIAAAGGAPPARYAHSAIYDPVRDRMVVFGGDAGWGFNNDLWALSLAGTPAWSVIGVGGAVPAWRYWHTAIYDHAHDRMVVFGGSGGIVAHNDVWAVSFAGSPTWNELAPAGESLPGRYLHTAMFDPVRDRMLVFGGSNGSKYLNGVWALSLAGGPAWSGVPPSESRPSERSRCTVVYDPLRDRLVLFGGYDGSYHNDVWALSLAGIPAWSALTAAGSPPAARLGHAAIYDPVRDQMVVFGGSDGSAQRNDVWALSLAGIPTWSVLVAAGTPPTERFDPTAIYDPMLDRMVVFGGWDGGYCNDVWGLSLAGTPTWSQLTTEGSPPTARLGHSAVYDPAGARMVIFGGDDGRVLAGRYVGIRNDVWELSLAETPAWNELVPDGFPPIPRCWHTAIHDPLRNRMVAFAGWDGDRAHDDVWELSLVGSAAWTQLNPVGTFPAPRYQHAAIYDPARNRMVALAGLGAGYRIDAWLLAWSPPVSVGGTVPGEFRLGSPRPNPSGHETLLEFALGQPGRAVIEVFDVRGRRVRRIADAWMSAGPHVCTWQGDDGDGHSLGSGVYFIRLQSGGFQAIRRVARVR